MGPLRYICEGRREEVGRGWRRLISGRTGGGDVLQTGRVRGSMQRLITCEGAKEDFQLLSVTLKQLLI